MRARRRSVLPLRDPKESTQRRSRTEVFSSDETHEPILPGSALMRTGSTDYEMKLRAPLHPQNLQAAERKFTACGNRQGAQTP